MEHYSDKDVRKIITRAMELQREEAGGTPSAHMGIADLEQIADEVGIDRRYVQRAAEELGKGATGRVRSFLGAPVTRSLSRVIETDASVDFHELVAAIPVLSGDSGDATTVGSTYTWITDRSTYDEKGRRTQVEIQRGDKGVSLRITESTVPIAGGLFGGLTGGLGLGGGLGVGLGVGLSQGLPVFTVAFPLAAVGFGYLLARFIYRAVSRSRSKRLQELMRALVERLGAAGGASA